MAAWLAGCGTSNAVPGIPADAPSDAHEVSLTDAADTRAPTDDADEGIVDAIDHPCSSENSGDCPKGYLCIQQSPTLCSGSHTGSCQPIPTTCPSPSGKPVCTCDGTEFRSACLARMDGYDRVFIACTTGSG